MTVYVSDLFTATPAPVNASPASTRTWQWLRGSSAISGATSSTYTAVTADIGSTLSATQLETNFLATTTATSAATEVVQAFDPIRLFSASEPGVWYDPSDMSTLYQNAAGTIPVTSFGQPVGLMLDKSRGLVLGPELVVNGDFSAGTTGWSLAVGWTVSGGTANINSAAGAAQITSTSFSSVVGATYIAKFTIVSASGTGVRLILGGAVVTGFLNAPGEYTYYLRPTTTGSVSIAAGGTDTIASIDNISVKELPGLHATQSTEASRPLYGIVPVSGRRNLLTWSEAFNEAVWAKTQASVTANTAIAPDGVTTADKLVEDGANSTHFLSQSVTTTAATHTFTVYLKNAERGFGLLYHGQSVSGAMFNLSSGAITAATGIPLATASAEDVGNGWYRCSITVAATAASNAFRVYTGTDAATYTYTGDGTSGIYVWGAQLETGSTPTAYQRVSTDLDVTEAGVASVGYLRFDGSTSWMVTPTITPGTDKVQVFAGVRKNSDAALAMLVEIDGVAATQTFFVAAPRNAATGDYAFRSAGSAASQAQTSASYVAPITNTLTALGDISGDLATLRVNGVQAAQNTADQGTGNYNPAPLYIGRRSGTSLPLNGHLFPLIVRFGPNLTAARIAATEAWVATKTGGVTL